MKYPSIEDLKTTSQIALSIVRHKDVLRKLAVENLEIRWIYEILDSLDLDGPMTAKEIARTFQHELAPLMIVLKQYLDNKILVKFYDQEKESIVYASTDWMLLEQHEFKSLLRSIQYCARCNQI